MNGEVVGVKIERLEEDVQEVKAEIKPLERRVDMVERESATLTSEMKGMRICINDLKASINKLVWIIPLTAIGWVAKDFFM